MLITKLPRDAITYPPSFCFFSIGSDLPAEAQQEARGIVSFKGCKLGVDQTIVQDPRSYGEQLIQGVIGIILNLDAGYDLGLDVAVLLR